MIFISNYYRESCFMVMSFCLSMHFMYENLKVGSICQRQAAFFHLYTVDKVKPFLTMTRRRGL